MTYEPTQTRRLGRTLSLKSITSLKHMLASRGVSAGDIDGAVSYACEHGANTMFEGFELAMSRALYSDEQLASGVRFKA